MGLLEGVYSPYEATRRPLCDTPLRTWLDKHGMSVQRFSRLIGCNYRTAQLWTAGQVIPSLVWAYRIDEVTKGEVAPSMWLGTDLGRHMWAAVIKRAPTHE